MQHFQSISHISAYISSLGIWAPLAAFLLFALQSLLPIFPYSILVAVAVVLFGGPEGYTIAIVGAITGSMVCYKLACGQGGEWFSKIILRWFGYDTKQTRPSIAFSGIFLAHLIQLVPNAVINFMAAINRVPMSNFLASTILGLIPVTLAYAGLGVLMYKMESISKALVLMLGILVLLYLGKNFVKKHWRKIATLPFKYSSCQGKESLSAEKSKA